MLLFRPWNSLRDTHSARVLVTTQAAVEPALLSAMRQRKHMQSVL
jgi:hypothetical protein